MRLCKFSSTKCNSFIDENSDVQRKLLSTDNARTTILIRAMVGAVFLSEGIQKFLFSDTLGVGRFAKIGLPLPDFLGPFIGSFEVVCGSLVLVGLITRLAAIPLLTIITVAIITTKIHLFFDAGFWNMLHESRTDYAMLLGCVFLIIKGGGSWSVDRSICK